MINNESKKLPAGLKMKCYACEAFPATHVCRYHVDELMVQICLCDKCMKLDTNTLLKNTLGINEQPPLASTHYMMV